MGGYDGLFFIDLMRFDNIILMKMILLRISSDSFIYLRFWAISYCVSSSANEPSETYRNWSNSLLPFLAHPSAIFDGIEIAHLRIWEVSPNFSFSGKQSEIR